MAGETRCPNCGAILGCSCELMQASNGKVCCRRCVMKENENFRNAKKNLWQDRVNVINGNRRNVIV